MPRSRTLTRIAVAAVAATAAVVPAAAIAGPAQADEALHYYSAPYLMPGESLPDVGAVMDATGQKTFMLAFILAPSDGSSCTPTWDGTRPLASDTLAQPVIDTVRSRGGDVSASVGGYGGTKLGQVCGSPEATAAAYQQVIDTYSLKAMDFDLEEPEYENTAAIDNEIGAIRILTANNSGLHVSITMPGTADGTGWFGQNVLTVAHNNGLTNANYSIMPFDGGFNGASSQTAALDAFNTKLASTFGWDSATAFAHEGVSMMNGVTDSGEHFTTDDFQTVLDYANAKGLGRYTFWSVGRPRPRVHRRFDHGEVLLQRHRAGRLGLHPLHRAVPALSTASTAPLPDRSTPP